MIEPTEVTELITLMRQARIDERYIHYLYSKLFGVEREVTSVYVALVELVHQTLNENKQKQLLAELVTLKLDKDLLNFVFSHLHLNGHQRSQLVNALQNIYRGWNEYWRFVKYNDLGNLEDIVDQRSTDPTIAIAIVEYADAQAQLGTVVFAAIEDAKGSRQEQFLQWLEAVKQQALS